MLRLWRHPNGGWYAVQTTDGKTQRTSLRTRDKAVAAQRLADLTTAPVGDTLEDIAQAYLNEKAGIPSAETLRINWMRLRPTFAHLRPDQVSRSLCREYAAARRAEGVKNGTIRKELSMLQAACRYHSPNTPANFELPPAAPPRDRRLTREEYTALLAGCVAPHVRLFVILALSTAGRKSAILELTWDRIDFERGLIHLHAGGARRKGRATVPMTALARESLSEAFKVATTKYVFEYGGERVANVKKGFALACARAGLKGVTPHVLRHTAASWMAEAGVPMPEIAAYLGHSDDRITQRVYAKYSPSYLRNAAAALTF